MPEDSVSPALRCLFASSSPFFDLSLLVAADVVDDAQVFSDFFPGFAALSGSGRGPSGRRGTFRHRRSSGPLLPLPSPSLRRPSCHLREDLVGADLHQHRRESLEVSEKWGKIRVFLVRVPDIAALVEHVFLRISEQGIDRVILLIGRSAEVTSVHGDMVMMPAGSGRAWSFA